MPERPTMSDDDDRSPLPSRSARVWRKVIRSVLVPLGLGLLAFSLEGYRFPGLGGLTVTDVFVAWFYGLLLLGLLALGVWMWNLLDLLGYPIKGVPGGGARRCPRCEGSGWLR